MIIRICARSMTRDLSERVEIAFFLLLSFSPEKDVESRAIRRRFYESIIATSINKISPTAAFVTFDTENICGRRNQRIM